MPPPPPPPPAPPPIPKQLGATNANHSNPPPDRNALLSQIRKGTRLKKAETNDRSSPLVDANRSTPSSSTVKRSTDTKSNGPIPIIPPGGLFAQGIPKLRPTVPRSENSPCASLPTIQSIRQNNSASSLRVNQLTGSRSQPPSPVSKPRLSPAVSVTRTVSSERNESISIGNPNFPDDVNLKGPAPAPPPQSQKPIFRSNTKTESDSSVKHSTVKRSASQTNLQRPRLTRPPPSEKPPPPPKSAPSAPQNAPPPPPSKPPNISRRQSFGVGESHNFLVNTNKNNPPKVISKTVGLPPPPPPPPRNNSAPNDLSQLSSSTPGSQWNKMNIAPPPPPNRAVTASSRSAPLRPPPPRAPAPAPPPPPPPQHQFPVHPAPPSQMKMMPASNSAPPPPARVSSIKQTDFEERFKTMFQSAQNLPKPDKFINCAKSYPSKMVRQRQSTRRQPPPPPPQHSLNKPNVPVQCDSGLYSGSYNHS